jgi:hypothetical protein
VAKKSAAPVTEATPETREEYQATADAVAAYVVEQIPELAAKSKKPLPRAQDVRESLVVEVKSLFTKADALLVVLESRSDERFAKARNKLAETVGALR